MPPAVATTLNQILVGDTALPIGTGTRAAIPGHEIAGKTGTSQDRFSVAFVGYTPQYAASVMVLNPKQNQDLGGFGGRVAAPIWRDAMLPILSAQEPARFPPAGHAAQRPDAAPVPRRPGPAGPTAARRAGPRPAPRPGTRGATAAGQPRPRSAGRGTPAGDWLGRHQLRGPLAQHHRGRRGPARGGRGRTEVSTTRSPATPRTRSCWSTTAPGSSVRAHPGRAGQVDRGGQVAADPAVERRVVVEHAVGQAGPRGDQRRERPGVRSSSAGQPHALPQPPPVGLRASGTGSSSRGWPSGSPPASVSRPRLSSRCRPTPTASRRRQGAPVIRLNGMSQGRTSRSPGSRPASRVQDAVQRQPRRRAAGRAGRQPT